MALVEHPEVKEASPTGNPAFSLQPEGDALQLLAFARLHYLPLVETWTNPFAAHVSTQFHSFPI